MCDKFGRITMSFDEIAETVATKGDFKKDWTYRFLFDAMPDASDGRMMAAARQVVRMAEELAAA